LSPDRLRSFPASPKLDRPGRGRRRSGLAVGIGNRSRWELLRAAGWEVTVTFVGEISSAGALARANRHGDAIAPTRSGALSRSASRLRRLPLSRVWLSKKAASVRGPAGTESFERRRPRKPRRRNGANSTARRSRTSSVNGDRCLPPARRLPCDPATRPSALSVARRSAVPSPSTRERVGRPRR
jgi:hypothetical protein